MTNAENPMDIYCAFCGSNRVTRLATVAWDVELQRWSIIEFADDSYCKACCSQTRIEKEPTVERPVQNLNQTLQ